LNSKGNKFLGDELGLEVGKDIFNNNLVFLSIYCPDKV